MKRLAILVLCALVPAAPAAFACDRADLCEGPPARRYPSLARTIGITIEPDWVAEHIDTIHESFGKHCEAFGNCLSVWGNPPDFCRLLYTVDLRDECEKTFDIGTDLLGWQQCRAVADIFSLNQNALTARAWPGLQECAAREAGSRGVPSPVVRVEPSDPEPGVETEFVVKAFDPETGYPMYGLVIVDGTMLGPTFQTFRHVVRFTPVSDEAGRISMKMPTIVVQASPARGSNAPEFAPATTTFGAGIPETLLTLEPPASEWTAGANVIRVTARDSKTGEVLAGRILKEGGVLGDVKDPVTIELVGGEVPCGGPIWFRPRQANRPDTSLPIPSCP